MHDWKKLANQGNASSTAAEKQFHASSACSRSKAKVLKKNGLCRSKAKFFKKMAIYLSIYYIYIHIQTRHPASTHSCSEGFVVEHLLEVL